MATSLTAIRVTGFNESVSDEELELFFESSKRTGGGDIVTLRVDRKHNVALIGYTSSEVAKTVASRQQLILKGFVLSVIQCSPNDEIVPCDHVEVDKTQKGSMFSEKGNFQGNETVDIGDRNLTTGEVTSAACLPADWDDNSHQLDTLEAQESCVFDEYKVFVINIPQCVTYDGLENYMETKSKCEVDTICFGAYPDRAIVSFKDKPDVPALRTLCATRPLEGATLDVDKVKRCRSIQVHDLPDGCTNDALWNYFETRRSGGGEVDDVIVHEGIKCAVVSFKDASVVKAVVDKTCHTLNSKEIKVLEFFEQNGCRHPDDDHSRPLHGLPNEIIVGAFDENVMSFLLGRECLRRSISDEVQKLHGNILWDSCTDDTFAISSTASHTSPGTTTLAGEWQSSVSSALTSLVAQYGSKEVSVSKTILDQASGKLAIFDNKSIQLDINPYSADSETCLVRITGLKDSVNDACSALQNLRIESPHEIIEKVGKLKKQETEYLNMIGFETWYSGCSINPTTNQVSFSGTLDHVTKTKARMLEELHSLTSTKVVLTSGQVRLLSKQECSDYINGLLYQAELKVVWLMSADGIELFSCDEEQKTNAANIIKEELKQVTVTVPDDTFGAFQDSAWSDFKSEQLTKYPGLIEITEDCDSGTLILTATRSVVDSVTADFQECIEQFTSDWTSKKQKPQENYNLQNTVEVTGFGPDTDQESIELFFEDTETSGGGEIKRISFDEMNRVAVIEFKDPSAVKRILEKEVLVIDGCNVTASLNRESETTDGSATLRVTGFDLSTSDEKLKLFFKNYKKSGGGDLKSLHVNRGRTAALVTYESAKVAERVAKKSELQLQGKMLSVEMCSVNDDIEKYDEGYLSMTAVRVTGFRPTTRKDTLELFFASNSKSGGAPLKLFKVNKRKSAALFDFGCRQVAERVAGRDELKLDGSVLSVVVCRPDEDIETTPSISRAALGRVAKIGDLYDIRTDNFLARSVFREDPNGSSVISSQVNNKTLEDVKVGDMHDTLEKLHVDPELQLSILTEVAKISSKGNEQWLSSAAHLIFREETAKEEFIISQNQDKINMDVIKSFANKRVSATHVMLGIVWGTLCTITPEIKNVQEQLHKDIVQQLRDILCRGTESETPGKTVKFWKSVNLHCNWDVFLPDGTSGAKKTRFKGMGDFLLRFPQVAKKNKPVPLAYLFTPVEEVARICDAYVKLPYFRPTGLRASKMILTFIKDITRRRQDISLTQSFLESSKDYLASEALRSIGITLQKVEAATEVFKDKLQQFVLNSRRQTGNTSGLEKSVYAAQQGFSMEMERQVSSLMQHYQRLKQIETLRRRGIVYVGKEDTLSVDDASMVYIFYKPALFNTDVEKVQHYFLRCQSSQSLQKTAKFKILDETIRPDLWPEKQEPVVKVYKNGHQISEDMYKKEYKELDRCLITCNVTELLTTSKIREEKAFVRLRCPNALSRSGKCSGKPLLWACAKCNTTVEYGLQSNYFYCKCGLSKPAECEFRCHEFEHGVDYFPFPEDLLVDELATLSKTTEKNILLLGETGVGKSTWINGIYNYLAFPDLNTAVKSDGLQSLIPSRFTFTKEGKSCEVKTETTSYNEVLESGQSATQSAQPYVVQFGDQKIRLIDTPGVGDSRGIEQDRENFDNILAHLSKYDEIHAICILLKPNNSRLSVVFRFCIQELLARLHPSAKDNIVFCFTNARATFYQPGDTLPVLNKMLETKNIGFRATPENYFCFDNEPFRFLVCLHNGIKFEETEVATYSSSWDKAVSETTRLFDKIKSMSPHKVRNTISLNEARRVIVAMSKPMAEVARTIQENVQLANDAKEQIDLHNQTVHDLTRSVTFLGHDLERHELPYPMTVCTDSSCIERVVVGNGNTHKINYTQICHHRCSITGIPTETTNDERLSRCWCIEKSTGTLNCHQCGHHYTQHMHLTYTLEKVSKMFISEEVQRQIQNKTSEKEIKALFKRRVDQKVRELKKEEKTILRVSAEYGAFLKKNCIIPYNDAVGDYINMIIDQEEKKPREMRNCEELVRLKSLRREYNQEKLFLDKALRDGYTTSPQDIMELQGGLFQLKHFGKTLKDIFDGISISRSANGYNEDEIVAPYIPPTTIRRGGESMAYARGRPVDFVPNRPSHGIGYDAFDQIGAYGYAGPYYYGFGQPYLQPAVGITTEYLNQSGDSLYDNPHNKLYPDDVTRTRHFHPGSHRTHGADLSYTDASSRGSFSHGNFRGRGNHQNYQGRGYNGNRGRPSSNPRGFGNARGSHNQRGHGCEKQQRYKKKEKANKERGFMNLFGLWYNKK